MKPARTLPLTVECGVNIMCADGKQWDDCQLPLATQRAAYMAHAANHYPGMVEELRKLRQWFHQQRAHYAPGSAEMDQQRDYIDAFLYKLGKAS